MKRIAIFIMGLVLAFSLCACACDNNAPATTPSTTNAPTTAPTTTPTTTPMETFTVPVPETNIPDPSVDSSMPDGGTEGGNSTSGAANGLRSRNYTME